VDVQDAEEIRRFASGVVQQYPALNAVILNAGIMKPEDLTTADVSAAEQTIAINLLGPIRLTSALMPHLLK